MSRKSKNTSNLGRSLIKDRFNKHHGRKFVQDNTMLHTTEIQDGYDWGRLNLQSVTEESSFQEFLSTADLAGTEFQAEKLNIKFINPKQNVGLLTKEEKDNFTKEFQENKYLMKIPRRPHWNVEMTADELHQKERDSFLEWRRSLSMLQEEKGLLLTPFEKNIEFWRQLWRVVEKSDVVVQIVDARNPLLFRCEDLEKYVKEVSEHKLNLILLNKADYLTEKQRQAWANYFDTRGIQVAFFSAILSDNSLKENNEIEDTSSRTSISDIKDKIEELDTSVEKVADTLSDVLNTFSDIVNTKLPDFSYEKHTSPTHSFPSDVIFTKNSAKILSRDELVAFLKDVHSGSKVTEGITTIGLVGYPNVGKSSTINALMTVKKVPVSATPGKTKHFQTLYLDKDLLLCDCPGLVMPSFMYTKAEMIVNGILPVDQMRDHVPPINLISNLIPRHVIEAKYGLMLPKPLEGEDENRCPTAEEILNAYGYNRGFMTANGQPDNPRSARYILKDFLNGKLLYVHPPPGFVDEEFQNWPSKQQLCTNRTLPPREMNAIRPHKTTTEELDRNFFGHTNQNIHIKGKLLGSASISIANNSDKPWKKLNKHANKKKKEKLRRVYAHLDQH